MGQFIQKMLFVHNNLEHYPPFTKCGQNYLVLLFQTLNLIDKSVQDVGKSKDLNLWGNLTWAMDYKASAIYFCKFKIGTFISFPLQFRLLLMFYTLDISVEA